MTTLDMILLVKDKFRYGKQDAETIGYNKAVMEILSELQDINTKEIIKKARSQHE